MSAEVTLLLLAAVAIVLWLWMRSEQPEEVEEPPSAHHSPFHCVAVVPGMGACQTAKTLKGRRFLSAEAPQFPLASCDCTRCKCTFAHYADRRHGDRRNPYSAESHRFTLKGGDERRRRRGRRQTDGMQVVHEI